MFRNWHSIQNTLRNFLFSATNKEFLTFLVFLGLSTAIWFATALNETYEKEIDMPLTIVDVPQNIIITDGLPDTIHVTLQDKGYSLIPYFYGDMLGKVSVSFKNTDKSNGKGSITSGDLQRLIYPKLYASTKIISVKAEKWDYYYNYGLSKKVPVFLDGKVKAADQYYIARTTFSPDSILIYASATMLDSIMEVYTEDIEIENLIDTLSRTLHLKKIRGVKMQPESTKVTFFADMLTEKTISVPITAINKPDGYILRTFPSAINVKVIVGRSKMNIVKAENFRVVVDFKEISNHPSDKCDLILRIVPKGITSASLEMQQVDYLIEKVE